MTPIQHFRSQVIRDMDLLHPKVEDNFRRLAHSLELEHKYGNLPVLFKVFETYRHPYRQMDLYGTTKNTNARQYESAHQFGFAADFVVFDNGKWSWDLKHPWPMLRDWAKRNGLDCPIEHDKCHVESPLWQDFRACLKSL